MIFLQIKDSINRNHNRYLLGILLVFGIIYSLISFVNHYLFLTYAYDLGIFNNAIYDYAHFSWNSNSIKLYDNILSDHFTLLHIPFSVFSWIFGTYTLLIFQVASILFGAYGSYKYHLLKSSSPVFSLILIFHFLSLWGIYSALSYDYHDNIIAAMLVPWFFYYFHQKKWLQTIIFFIIIIISKENMALWAIFLCSGLTLIYFHDKQQRNRALLFAVISTVYFILVVKLIIPSLAAGDRSYDYVSKYAALGNGFSDIIYNCFNRPQYVFSLLFENHTQDPLGDGGKSELHWMVLISGGISVLMQPVYLLMLLPIYAQKLFSSHPLAWGINYQYSIEFVPIINFALGSLALKYPNWKKWFLVIFFAVLTFGATYRSTHFRTSKSLDKRTIQFYHYHRYERHFDAAEAHKAIEEKIPKDAPVSALSPLVPHLAFRDYIFEFPNLGNAHYIALIMNNEPWEKKERYETEINLLMNSADWEIIYNKNSMVIFKKRGATPDNVQQIESFEKPGAVKTVKEVLGNAETNEIQVH